MLNIITNEVVARDPEEVALEDEVAQLGDLARSLLQFCQQKESIAIEFRYELGDLLENTVCRGLLIVEPSIENSQAQVPLSAKMIYRLTTPPGQLPAEFEVELSLLNLHRGPLECRLEFTEGEEDGCVLWEGTMSKDLQLPFEGEARVSNRAVVVESHFLNLARASLLFNRQEGQFLELPRREDRQAARLWQVKVPCECFVQT